MADTFLPSVLFGAQGQRNLTPGSVTWSGPYFRTERKGSVDQTGSLRVNQEQASLGKPKGPNKNTNHGHGSIWRWYPTLAGSVHFQLVLPHDGFDFWDIYLNILDCRKPIFPWCWHSFCSCYYVVLFEELNNFLSKAISNPHRQSQMYSSVNSFRTH